MNAAVLWLRKPTNAWKAVFCAAALLLFLPALKAYPGSAAVYVLFAAAFNALLLAGFREKRLFFDTFSGGFLWLGFWFKLSAILVLAGGRFTEPVGDFSFSPAAFDRALLISACGAMALLLASFLRERLFVYPEAQTIPDTRLQVLYESYRIRVWVFFLLAALLTSAANVYWGFYQRGVPPRTVLPFGLSSVYTLMLLFGLSSAAAVLLDLESRRRKAAFFPAAAAMAECFLSNLSMFSRGMVLNGAALLYGFYSSCKARGAGVSSRYWAGLLLTMMLLFGASFIATNYFRLYFFDDQVLTQTPAPSQAVPMHPVINRWVGLEGVMSISAYGGLGWDLWKAAWGERFSDNGTSFYDETIIKDSPYLRPEIAQKHFITLPGIVAFLFYPGSYLFLFAALLLLGLAAAALEAAVYRLSGRNLVLAALLAQVLAGRLAHFGYAPSRSYMLLGGVLGVTAAIFLLRRWLSRGEPA